MSEKNMSAEKFTPPVPTEDLKYRRDVKGYGWVEFNGGQCPVRGDIYVVAMIREDCMTSNPVLASSLDWSNNGGGGDDIIAYRQCPGT